MKTTNIILVFLFSTLMSYQAYAKPSEVVHVKVINDSNITAYLNDFEGIATPQNLHPINKGESIKFDAWLDPSSNIYNGMDFDISLKKNTIQSPADEYANKICAYSLGLANTGKGAKPVIRAMHYNTSHHCEISYQAHQATIRIKQGKLPNYKGTLEFSNENDVPIMIRAMENKGIKFGHHAKHIIPAHGKASITVKSGFPYTTYFGAAYHQLLRNDQVYHTNLSSRYGPQFYGLIYMKDGRGDYSLAGYMVLLYSTADQKVQLSGSFAHYSARTLGKSANNVITIKLDKKHLAAAKHAAHLGKTA